MPFFVFKYKKKPLIRNGYFENVASFLLFDENIWYFFFTVRIEIKLNTVSQ